MLVPTLHSEKDYKMNEDELEFLQRVAAAATDYPNKLNAWEKTFMSDFGPRVEKYALDTHCSGRQWDAIRKIATKLDVEE